MIRTTTFAALALVLVFAPACGAPDQDPVDTQQQGLRAPADTDALAGITSTDESLASLKCRTRCGGTKTCRPGKACTVRCCDYIVSDPAHPKCSGGNIMGGTCRDLPASHIGDCEPVKDC